MEEEKFGRLGLSSVIGEVALSPSNPLSLLENYKCWSQKIKVPIFSSP